VESCRSRVVAWGPVGLDLSEAGLRLADETLQTEVLQKQIAQAVHFGLPLVVDLSGAHDSPQIEDLLLTILGRSLPAGHGLYFASFRGSEEFFVKTQKKFPQSKVGFNGRVSFTREKLLHSVAFDVPLDRFLLESAAPHSPPTESGLGYSNPGTLPWVVDKIAALKSLETEVVYRAARENARHFFGI